MNVRRVFSNNFVRDAINDLNWIVRFLVAGLLLMLMTGRTTLAEIWFYTNRTSVELAEGTMGLYSVISSWMTVNNLMWTTVILFIAGALYGVIMMVVGSIRDRRKTVTTESASEWIAKDQCCSTRDLISK
jgi:hypothetical protein